MAYLFRLINSTLFRTSSKALIVTHKKLQRYILEDALLNHRSNCRELIVALLIVCHYSLTLLSLCYATIILTLLT